jgi:hypothetical protein
LHALKVAGRVVHVRLLYFYVVQAHHGIEFNSVDLGSFANHLPMHLTIGRHIDHDIAAYLRGTAKTTPLLKPIRGRVNAFHITEWRQV